jgi:hypothetical protein
MRSYDELCVSAKSFFWRSENKKGDAVGFYFQELDVYYIALGLVDSVLEILKKQRSGRSALFDQFEKTAIEIPLTLARIAGESGDKISGDGYQLVRGVVFECQALVEMLWRQKLIEEKETEDLNDTLMVISNLITDLAGSTPKETQKKIPVYKPRHPAPQD